MFIAIFCLIAVPFLVLFHQIGHALGVVLTSKSEARVYLGPATEENTCTFSIGRIHFHLILSYEGSVQWDTTLTKAQRIVAYAGGPLMTLVLTGLLWYIVTITPEGNFLMNIANGFFLIAAAMLILTATPMAYPRWAKARASDGLQIIRAVRD